MSARRAAVVALLFLLNACPARTPHPAASIDTSPGARSTVVPSGSMTVAYPDEPATLDPFARGGDGAPTRALLDLMCPGLSRGLLATPETATVGSTLVVLRSGARWSDGVAITTDDLIATWRAARAAGRATAITSVTRTDATHAVLRTTGSAWKDTFDCILPAHALGARGHRALAHGWSVSGGPFVLRAWHDGLDMTFAAVPNAWLGAPMLASLRIVFVPDTDSALALLRTHRVDALVGYASPDWARRCRDAGASVTRSSPVTEFLQMTGAVFDARVRAALVRSIDRARIQRGLIQTDASGLGAADLSRARALLASDGWTGSPVRFKHGRKLSVTIAYVQTDDMAAIVARAVQYQAARAGIDVQPIGLEAARFWSSWLGGPLEDAAIVPGVAPGSIVLFREPVITAARAGSIVSAPPAGGRAFAQAAAWSRQH